MSVLRHTTDTIGSILGAVATTANATSRTVTTAATGLDMLDAFIQKAKRKQTIDIAAEMDNYAINVALEAGAEQQRKEEAILREMHSDPIRKAHFDRIHSRLTAAIEAATAA